MERRSIGVFIAALRKANGMTQRELAEKLNVSDKTISRWERDDGAPDLAAIPVLAEIFSVSCDELLRGERRSPEERSTGREDEATAKGEKQRQRLLTLSLVRLQNRSYITMAMAALGLAAAMVVNFGFYRAKLGFLVGLVFSLASAVCQLIFRNNALLTVSDMEGDPKLGSFRLSVFRRTEYSLGLNLVLLGSTLPLMLPFLKSNMGLDAGIWLRCGAISGGLVLLAVCIVCYIINGSRIRSGAYCLLEKTQRTLVHRHRLKGRCAVGFLLMMAVTALIHAASTQLWGPWSIMEYTAFQDYDSFKAYMEKSVKEPSMDIAEPIGPASYYDENGNVISEEEASRHTLTDGDGNVVCEYIQRNHAVCRVQSKFRGKELLELRVSTYDQLSQAKAVAQQRHAAFAVAYCAEMAAAFAFYFKKRR